MDDFLPLDPTQDLIFPPELMLLARQQGSGRLVFQGERLCWISPGNLAELLELKAQHPSAPLVIGNTTIGISFGAGCSLSVMKDELKRVMSELSEEKVEVYRALLQTVSCLAGKQIRNMAVTCVGQIIGAIVADTRENPRRAVECVKVTYEDLTPVLFTIEEAIEQQSFYNPQRKLERGSVDGAWESVDHIFEGEIYMGGQEHFYMETQGLIAVPKGEDGEMELFAATQHAAFTQVRADPMYLTVTQRMQLSHR
ncbi:UNVERIFIED_CONTAM: hypothetical protein FKN15_025074 [Acipenser sinensis]